jgi:outer membrane protein TolC
VQPVAYRAEPAVQDVGPVAPPQFAPFEGLPELTADELVREVLARSPSLAQMVAAWQAASARYPQVTALEDPTLMGKIAPAAVGANPVRDDWYTVEVSQKLPFPGKLRLRGENALAEASAAGREVDDMRLQLVESARSAFYEYYVSERTLEVNAENLEILKRLRKSAESQYTSGKTKTNQEILQADVEIGREEERRLGLEQARRVAVARINTLMHLPPDSALPSSPKRVDLAQPLPDAATLRAVALARRPDLQAIADRIRAEEAALGVAEKEFCPDFEVAAGYDAMWDTRNQRPEVNVRLNVPLYRAKRHAAVSEAQARIAQRRAELDRRTDQVNFEVQEAFEQVRRGEQSVRLYEKTILPKAKDNREAAESAYEKGLIPFVSLIDARRNEFMLRERFHEAVAEYHRRRAALERAVGGTTADGSGTGQPLPGPCLPVKP